MWMLLLVLLPNSDILFFFFAWLGPVGVEAQRILTLFSPKTHRNNRKKEQSTRQKIPVDHAQPPKCEKYEMVLAAFRLQVPK